MPNKLLIVESPNKVKTIQKYLGDEYEVKSSVGHILKLSTKGEYHLGIDFDNWEPIMIVDSTKTKIIKELKDAAKNANEILVATDPDREGEAIAKNLVDTLKVQDKYKRIKYNEITKEAIEYAINNPLEIDENLVKAQKTRRLLDRIIGFKLSELMQKKIKNAPTMPSAGRVQSIALKLVCDREKEIELFIPIKYSKIEANIDNFNNPTFYYKLADKDFDNDNTWISPTKIEKIYNDVKTNNKLRIIDIKITKSKEKQIIPFKQSVLYKDAKYSSQVVQSSAQSLFEHGLISYPRTDSTRISESFIQKAKKYIAEKFGNEYVANDVKGFSGEQDAHEAIRPTNIELTPDFAKINYSLNEIDAYIYTLIYNRTISAIMATPIRETHHYDLLNKTATNEYYFKTSYSKLLFDGYYKVLGYPEMPSLIPNYQIGDYLDVNEYIRLDKQTQPPARYNDGSLIKKLDDIKVGRPSTFASTVSVIKKRLFVETHDDKTLHPTEFGKTVLEKLINGFPKTINEEYTAQVEEVLDEISDGKQDYKKLLQDFWDKFNVNYEWATETIEISILPQELVNEKCPNCGSDLIYRYTKLKKQKFIGCSNFPACRYVKNIEDSKPNKWRFFRKKAK